MFRLGFTVRPVMTETVTAGTNSGGVPESVLNWVRLVTNGTNLGFFKDPFLVKTKIQKQKTNSNNKRQKQTGNHDFAFNCSF